MDEQTSTLTPMQGPLLRRRSNLDCFLDNTAPSVRCHYLLEVCLSKTLVLYGYLDSSIDNLLGLRSSCAESACNAWKDCCKISMPNFRLTDLWTSFDEWSAYGVGVPLVLPFGETVVQYYVPYLSAIQIYMQAGCGFSPNNRRERDDSDWSDVNDGRETSSDGGSDDSDMTPSAKSGFCDHPSCLSFERLSSNSPSNKQQKRRSNLLFEYFERGPPYNRAPLAGKIRELAACLPQLLTLSSDELLPSSWFSVAWYPIYRIPMGHTMTDLSTCFLTFHTLWTPLLWQGQEELEEESLRACENGGDVRLLELEQETRKEQEQWLQDHSAWRLRSRSLLEIPAFGLASYKLGGPFWEYAGPRDKQHLTFLAASAEDWLQQLRVHHPDFDFFTSKGLRL